jgi:hypothetical protein
LRDEWTWLVDNRAAAADAEYRSRQGVFFGAFGSPLGKLKATYSGSQAQYWLKNTAPQIVDIIYSVADADLTPLQLYAYAQKEGLVDYVRDQLGLAARASPTSAQLRSVSTTASISGFDYLGLVDYGSELTAVRHPLTSFLPSGYDRSKASAITRSNEHRRTVSSAEFPNLAMALQALAAMIKRRRTLFVEDAKAAGYPKPTEDELVYWTYVYFNAGEYGAKEQLVKYNGARKLVDWVSKGEYANSIKLLQTFRMLRDMNLFP